MMFGEDTRAAATPDLDSAAAKTGTGNRDLALQLAAAGLPVFPARATRRQDGTWSKKPCILGWQNKATTNSDEIKGWWQSFPDAVVGIELRRARLLVVDTDRHPGGPDGVSAFAKLVADHGDLPTHPVTVTPGGGEHHFFEQSDQMLGNRTGCLPPGIDVRGVGGWIVAPGSLRPDGEAWAAAETNPDLIRAVTNKAVPKVPAWLDSILRSSRSTSEAALQKATKSISGATRGARNNTLYIEGSTLGRLLAQGLLTRQAVITTLLSASQVCGLVDDDGEAAVMATISSALSVATAPAKEEPDAQLLYNLAPVALDELMAMDLPVRNAVLEGLLFERGIAMVYAWRGVGKTWFGLGLAAAIASGGSFLRWTSPRPRKVLHVCGEMPASDLRDRLRATVAGLNRPLADPSMLRVLSADLHEFGIPDLSTREGQLQFEKIIGDSEVLSFDNISTLFRTGDENDAESWIKVQPWLLDLRRRGKTSIMVHHSGKGGKQRGTSKREDVLDLVVNLKHPRDYDATEGARFEVHFEKARGLTGDAVETFEATLSLIEQRANWTVKSIEDTQAEEVRALKQEGKSLRDIAAELGMSKSKVQRIISKS